MNWIDKNKRLPPLGEYVDTSVYVHVTDGKLIGHGCYNYDCKDWTYYMPGQGGRDDNKITHWMPLMKLPSENIAYIEYPLDGLWKLLNTLKRDNNE